MNYPFNPSPSYSFSVAKKIQSHFLLPQVSMGPGQYNPQIERKGGTLNFGSYSQRKMILAQDTLTPGPLHYTINSVRSQGVSFANSKKVLQKPTRNPGPGQYLPIDEPHSRLGGSISRTSRNNNFDNQIPGAGHYPIKSTLKSLSFKFKQLHKRAKTDYMSPGPGSYSILSDSMNHGIKMHNSKRTWSYILKTETPGPGTYQSESFIQNRVSSKHSKPLLRNNQKSQINASPNTNQNNPINQDLVLNLKVILILMEFYRKDKKLNPIRLAHNKTLVMLIIDQGNMVNQKQLSQNK